MERRGHDILRPETQPPGNLFLRIIGGQLQSDVPMIQYALTDPTLTDTYDPEVDTDYPIGLGNAELWGDGELIATVLVRHNFPGFPSPLMAGDDYLVNGTMTITIDSGAHEGEVLTFYTVKRG